MECLDEKPKRWVWNSTCNANQPNEDTMSSHQSIGKEGHLFAVCDGHGGGDVSALAKRHLLPEIASALARFSKVEHALHEGFRVTEKEAEHACWNECQSGRWKAASVGSCALVAHLSVDRSQLTVANAGDCRAVLATRRSGSSTVEAVALSHDHNSREKHEQEVARKEHPGEDDILYQATAEAWYIKGRLQPTRSLGDFYLKQERFNAPQLGARRIPDPFSPPYVKWTPEVSTRPVVGGDLFLILATDGLWDEMSSQTAAELAHKAMEQGVDPAQALVRAARFHAAQQAGISVGELDAIAQQQRSPFSALGAAQRHSLRNIHDDITVVVVAIS